MCMLHFKSCVTPCCFCGVSWLVDAPLRYSLSRGRWWHWRPLAAVITLSPATLPELASMLLLSQCRLNSINPSHCLVICFHEGVIKVCPAFLLYTCSIQAHKKQPVGEKLLNIILSLAHFSPLSYFDSLLAWRGLFTGYVLCSLFKLTSIRKPLLVRYTPIIAHHLH